MSGDLLEIGHRQVSQASLRPIPAQGLLPWPRWLPDQPVGTAEAEDHACTRAQGSLRKLIILAQDCSVAWALACGVPPSDPCAPYHE